MINKLAGFIGVFLISAFVLGLAASITEGFAGFWGGLPFWTICLGVLSLLVYDYWDSCWRRK